MPHEDRPLHHRRFLLFVADEFEDLELWYPTLRLREAGAEVRPVGAEAGRIYRGKHGLTCTAQLDLDEIAGQVWDGVICPGGWAPDKLRRDPRVLEAVRQIAHAGRLVAAICHGGWIPASAGIYRGVRATGAPSIRDDLVNAGALWEDRSVVIDRNFVSSRNPDDLPDFCTGILAVCAGAEAGAPRP